MGTSLSSQYLPKMSLKDCVLKLSLEWPILVHWALNFYILHHALLIKLLIMYLYISEARMINDPALESEAVLQSKRRHTKQHKWTQQTVWYPCLFLFWFAYELNPIQLLCDGYTIFVNYISMFCFKSCSNTQSMSSQHLFTYINKTYTWDMMQDMFL